MTTFVLVHGAWHGGGAGARRSVLRRAGHACSRPRSRAWRARAPRAPRDRLDLHIQDVVAVLEMEDMREVVLLVTATAAWW